MRRRNTLRQTVIGEGENFRVCSETTEGFSLVGNEYR